MIRIDHSDFSRGIAQETKLIAEVVASEVEAMALEIMSGVMMATPVDTGQARNGWQKSGNAERTVIENNVPYINRLNAGHSKQAPAGFVEAVIDEVMASRK